MDVTPKVLNILMPNINIASDFNANCILICDIFCFQLDTISPSKIAFDKNRDNVFLIHDLESPQKTLHVTKTFGLTYGHVQDYVRNFFFNEVGDKLYIERMKPNITGKNHAKYIIHSLQKWI